MVFEFFARCVQSFMLFIVIMSFMCLVTPLKRSTSGSLDCSSTAYCKQLAD